MTCPSRFALAQWDADGGRSDEGSELAGHVGQCAPCASTIGQLAEARHELLGADPALASLRAARRILAVAEERRTSRRLSWWVPVMFAPVAALLALFIVPLDRGPTATLTSPVQAVRVKGQLAIEAYGKRGENIFPVSDGSELIAGDRLRFAYTKAEPGHLMVFGVDDGGEVFPYYQDGILAGITAQAGSKVMLPGSVELDGHRGWERVFALWSATPLDEQAVRKAVIAAMAGAGGDIRRAARLALPVEQVSYLLRRP